MIKKYIPVSYIIEALQYTGDNMDEVFGFVKGPYKNLEDLYPQVYDSLVIVTGEVYVKNNDKWIPVNVSDYIVKYNNNEFNVLSCIQFESSYKEI